MKLYIPTYLKYVASKKEYDDPHDIIDQGTVSTIAYSDFALTESRWREMLLQGAGRNSEKAKRIVSHAPTFVQLIRNYLDLAR